MKQLLRESGKLARRALFIIVATLILIPGVFEGRSRNAYVYSGGDWGGRDLVLTNGDTLSGIFSNVGLFRINPGAAIISMSRSLGIYAGRLEIDGSIRFNSFASPSLTLSANNQIVLGSNAKLNVAGTGAGGSISFVTHPVTALKSVPPAAGATLWGGGSNISAGGTLLSRFADPISSQLRQTGSTTLISNPAIVVGYPSIVFNPIDASIGVINPLPARVSNHAGLVTEGHGSATTIVTLTPDMAVAQTPIPAAFCLLGSGLMGLAAVRKKLKK